MNYFKTAVLLAGMTALFMAAGYFIGGRAGMIIALVVAIGMNFFSYWNSDKMVLRRYKAQPITQQSAPELWNLVAQLAQQAQLPMPAVYILPEDQPNAFATGRNANHAAVAVTQGILNLLNRNELAGVIGHELTHIKNKDILTMTITASIAGAISMLANFGLFFRGGNSRNRGGAIFSLIAVFVAPMAAGIVQMAISRTREFAADRGGAKICGHPLWLANALRRLQTGIASHPNPIADNNPASAHMFIMNPLSGKSLSTLFATHPKLEERIARLEAMSQKMDAVPPSAPTTPLNTSTQQLNTSTQQSPWK